MNRDKYIKPEIEVIEYISEGVMANTTIAIDNNSEEAPVVSRSKRRSFWGDEE